VPELPEVEITRRGIAPHLQGRAVERIVVRQPRLRWPVPARIRRLRGQTFTTVRRRGKYLLLETVRGTAIIHLGMSGSLRIVPAGAPPGPHDHVDIELDDGRALRLRDPRRFGALLWTERRPLDHPLLAKLGPEPLEAAFDGAHLFARSRGRRLAVKPFIMDAAVVVGVGNIYASETLFRAEIHPFRAAGRISLPRHRRLADAIQQVLREAIDQGGTSLRDFTRADGEPGYFGLSLQVYGRAGDSCARCGRELRMRRQGQRATYYCGKCQR